MSQLHLTDDQEMVVDTVRKFVADAVAPGAQEADEHRTWAGDGFVGLAELGVFGLSVAEEHGGAGLGLVPYVAALEAVGAHSGSLARLWVGQAAAAFALAGSGAAVCDAVLSGERVVAFVGREHGFTFVGGKLTGCAELVPGAMQAGVFVVVAKAGEGDVVVVAEAGALQREELRALGFASAACGRIAAEAAAATVAVEGAAAAQAIARAEIVAWLGSAASAVGAAQGATALAQKHASERIAFGKPLLAQQAVQHKIVECRRQWSAAQLCVWQAARLFDAGADAAEAAMQARIGAVDAGVHCADEAIQIHGGFGYTVEYHVERHYRDAKTFEVLDGGTAALRARLAAQLG
jgi:alkylation response protein AidB-like acyl-CoA dehydrogenase